MARFMDLSKARDKMRVENLDGLLICSPENFIYATGYTPLLLDLYRQAPLALCFIPRDENTSPVLFLPETDVEPAKKASGFDDIISFPVWWEVYNLSTDEAQSDLNTFLQTGSRNLPEQFDVVLVAKKFANMLQKKHLDRSRIGIEMDFISANVLSAFSTQSPNASFLDSTSLMYLLRSIKTPQEVDYLRKASLLTEQGILHSAQAIKTGATVGELTSVFQQAVIETARRHALLDLLGTMGGQPGLGASDAISSNIVRSNTSTTVKYDMQVSIAHYHSDVGRTYIHGQPTELQSRFFNALLETHNCLLEAVKPGLGINKLYQIGRDSLDKHGLSRISRGHFGHSVGLDSKIEEPPFISNIETSQLQPGMVLAVETPCYFEGIGKYQIEDMVLVTPDGSVNFNQISKDWAIPVGSPITER